MRVRCRACASLLVVVRRLRDGERGDKSNTVGVASWSARRLRDGVAHGVQGRAVLPAVHGLRRRAAAGVVLRRAGAGRRRVACRPGAVLVVLVLAGSHAAPLVLAVVLRCAGAGRRAAPPWTVPGGAVLFWPLAVQALPAALADMPPALSQVAAQGRQSSSLAREQISHTRPLPPKKIFLLP